MCINQGTQINIATGGQLFINGQDYTSILTNGYNNVYDKFFTNQPILGGTYYALNKIETSSSVNTLPGQTTELIAGRKIVLNPRFVAYAGFHASIDKNINNCVETPCGSGMRIGNFNANNSSSTATKGNQLIAPKENANLYQIQVFPNPNSGVFTLTILANNKKITQATTKEQFNISITNSMGATVFKKQVNTLTNNISVTNLPKGIYYVNVVSNGNKKVGEAIIIR